MMLDKDICGLFSIALAVLSNGAYLVSVVKKRTHPHVFSWTIWGLLTAITFFAQRSADAGPGAWHMAVNSAICFVVAVLALTRGTRDITRVDAVMFVCALAAIPAWYVTRQPFVAVVVVISVEAFAYLPTFRKSYTKPHEELAFTYVVDALRCIISVFAIESYSLTTTLYPLFIVGANTALVAMLVDRRRAPQRRPLVEKDLRMATPLYYQSHVFCCTNRRPDGHKEGCCASKGGEQLRNYMKKRAKELGIGQSRINGAGCLGRCELGPVLVIYPEGVWYSPKNESDIDEILMSHLQHGKTVERLVLPSRS